MLLAIPYQTLEVGKVHLDSFRIDRKGRPLAPLTYKDASVDLGDLTLLTPDLPVVRHDSLRSSNHSTGAHAERLVLDITGTHVFQTKLNTLHEYIAASLYLHRLTFFGKDISAEEVKSMLQPLLVGPHLHLYTHAHTRTGNGRDTAPEKVRALVRIHGILKFENRSGALQLRIQHSVPKIWTVRSA
jgi:hypothetical protein